MTSRLLAACMAILLFSPPALAPQEAPAPGKAPAVREAPPDQESPEIREVLAVVQGAFDAMREKDGDRLRALFHPQARLFSTGLRPAGTPVGVATLEEFIGSVTGSASHFDERFHDPQVRISGDLAAVWTPYVLLRDGEFSHCGIDAFHLMRTSSGWRVVDLAYTRTTDGCPPVS